MGTVTNEPSPTRVAVLVVMYAACSSSLSIVNKWAIMKVPYPSIVTACQFLTTSTTVLTLGRYLDVEALDSADIKILRDFIFLFSDRLRRAFSKL